MSIDIAHLLECTIEKGVTLIGNDHQIRVVGYRLGCNGSTEYWITVEKDGKKIK